MKLAAIILVILASKVLGMNPTELKATTSRINGKDNEFSFRINYELKYEAKLGGQKGILFQQRVVTFYDRDKHIGSYFYWQDAGSGLPSATTFRDLHVKPAKFTRVRIIDRFYDVNWRDGRLNEEELGRWFTQTWYLFNSCDPKRAGSGYYLCDIDDVPRMDGYLQGSGFTVYKVLEHTFYLSNEASLPQKSKTEPQR